jgi:hypothetical protein
LDCATDLVAQSGKAFEVFCDRLAERESLGCQCQHNPQKTRQLGADESSNAGRWREGLHVGLRTLGRKLRSCNQN